MNLICVQNQLPESSGNYKTTLEKGGKNPPDVTLEDVVKDLLDFFNGFKLAEAKKEIEEKYDIKKEHGNCWPADDIKRAWGKAKRLKKKNRSKSKHWAYVIMFQMIKRWLYYDECKRREESRSEQMDTDEENANWEAAKPRINEQPGPSNQKSKTSKHQKTKTSKQTNNQQSSAPKHNETESSLQSEQTFNKSDKSNERKLAKETPNQKIYIRIPLSAMSGTESTSEKDEKCPESFSSYKLLDKSPSQHEMKNEIRKRKSYIMSYVKETKSPEWVYEILNKNTLKLNCKKNMSFGNKDFKWEGYDQGHLAAAANHMWCQEAYHDTFLLSNMTPQISDLNKGNWCKLEQYCRNIVKGDNVRNVHVYTGPLYLKKERDSYVRVPDLSKMKSLGNKVVPTHFFKVVIVEENNGTVREPKCYRMSNEKSENKPEEAQVKKEGQVRTIVVQVQEHQVKVQTEVQVQKQKEQTEVQVQKQKVQTEVQTEVQVQKQKVQTEVQTEVQVQKQKVQTEVQTEVQARTIVVQVQEHQVKVQTEVQVEKQQVQTKVQQQQLQEELQMFETNIEDIEKQSGLTFKQYCHKCTPDKEKTVKWTGEDKDGDLHCVDFKVRICSLRPNVADVQ